MEKESFFVMGKTIQDSHWVIVTSQLESFDEAKVIYEELLRNPKPIYKHVKIGKTIYG